MIFSRVCWSELDIRKDFRRWRARRGATRNHDRILAIAREATCTVYANVILDIIGTRVPTAQRAGAGARRSARRHRHARRQHSARRGDGLEHAVQLGWDLPGSAGEQVPGTAGQAAPGAAPLLTELVLDARAHRPARRSQAPLPRGERRTAPRSGSRTRGEPAAAPRPWPPARRTRPICRPARHAPRSLTSRSHASKQHQRLIRPRSRTSTSAIRRRPRSPHGRSQRSRHGRVRDGHDLGIYRF